MLFVKIFHIILYYNNIIYFSTFGKGGAKHFTFGKGGAKHFTFGKGGAKHFTFGKGYNGVRAKTSFSYFVIYFVITFGKGCNGVKME
jgi:hypothetical protein